MNTNDEQREVDQASFQSWFKPLSNAVSNASQVIVTPITKYANPVIRFLNRLLKPFQIWWRVIKPGRVAIVFSLALSFFLLKNDQAKDILQLVVEQGLWSSENAVLAITLLIYALAGWYFSRAVLYVFYNSFTPGEENDQKYETLRTWTARITGAAPIFALGWAFTSTSIAHSIFYLLLAIIFLGVLMARRKYILPKMYADDVKEVNGKKVLYVGLHRDEGLTERTRKFVIGYSLLALGVFLLTLYSRVAFPSSLGVLGVVFIGAAGLVVYLTLFTYWRDYYDLPSLILLVLLLAIVVGLYNDNHDVRTIEGGAQVTTSLEESRRNVAAHFEEWLRPRLSEKIGSDAKYPVFLVSAEGGGIRAAYWTAAVLARLREDYPDFACHIFSISGVSGGSLGGGAFVADLANDFRNKSFHCFPETSLADDVPPARKTSLAFLGADFLAPTVAGLLFPDLMSRFNPFCPWLFCLPDRATYLEEAWEENWFAHNQEAEIQFSDPFLKIWEGEAIKHIPSLFLNGTWVESGGRNVTSNLKVEAKEFSRVQDMLGTVKQSIGLSTAVHMSARFTYVSPPGTIRTENGDLYVVDGGYFENSGALMTKEIVRVLKRVCDDLVIEEKECKKYVDFYAIVISNNTKSMNADLAPGSDEEPVINVESSSETETASADHNVSVKNDPPNTAPLLNEVLAPVRTLLNTRVSRGILSEDELFSEFSEGQMLRFQLRDPRIGNSIPLGWVLSDCTQKEMRKQALDSINAYKDLITSVGFRNSSNGNKLVDIETCNRNG